MKKKRVAHEDSCVRLCLSEGWYDAISLPLEIKKKHRKFRAYLPDENIKKKKKKKIGTVHPALFIRYCSPALFIRHCSSDTIPALFTRYCSPALFIRRENFYYYRCDQNTSLLYPNILDVSVYITILIRVFFHLVDAVVATTT